MEWALSCFNVCWFLHLKSRGNIWSGPPGSPEGVKFGTVKTLGRRHSIKLLIKITGLIVFPNS